MGCGASRMFELHDAVVADNVRQAALLIQNGADVNKRDKYGVTALHNVRGAAMVDLLVNRGATLEAADELYKATPLLKAAEFGRLEAVQAMVARGADPNVCDRSGATALAMACGRTSQLSVAEYLVQQCGLDVNAADQYGQTPLMRAAHAQRKELVEYLIANGANVNAQTEGTLDERCSPLSRAIEKGDLGIVEVLLAHGADPNLRNRHGVTALMAAAKQGQLNIVKCLVAKGADAAAVSNSGQAATELAAKAGHTAVVEYLRSIETGRQ